MTTLPSNGQRSQADVYRLRRAVRDLPTGNALPILSEVLEALGQLVETGKTRVIDLGAIPFTGGDEKIMQEMLGDGEVSAVLNAMGESHIQETAIPGVWRVDHYDLNGEVQARFIEITTMPDILRTQPEDAARGHEMLTERLQDRLGTAETQEDCANAK